jgi:hypothetical protein
MAVALALGLAALVSSEATVLSAAGPASARPASPAAAVQAMLDARSAALARGDRAAWLADVDPQANAQFVEAQARTFDGLRSLPLDRYGLRLDMQEAGDLAPGAGLAKRYGVPAFAPETRQIYRLRGYDDRDAVDTLWWTYVQRNGRWYVASDSDLANVGLDSSRNLWDLGPVRVRPTAHFLVISHPAQAARADALAAIAEQAVAVLGTRWHRPWSQRIPMILPGSVAELGTLLQSTFDLNNFVAFVVYDSVRDNGWDPTAPRIFIQDQNLARYSHASQVQTLVHELTHAASVPLAGPAIPSWLHEGIADWVAKGEKRSERRPAGADHLPRDDEFSTGSNDSIVEAYDSARSAIADLSGRAGVDAPVNVFAEVGAAKVAPGSSTYLVDKALRDQAHITLNDLTQIWVKG